MIVSVTDRPAPLTPLDETWERALCVVAHPDDLEFGAAAAVARWTGQGKTVVYCMVTSGEAGIDGHGARPVPAGPRGGAAPVRGRSSASTTVEFLGQPDGVLEYGVALRKVIAASVRRHRPEIVVTGNFRDTWGGVNLNQADHIATGRAVRRRGPRRRQPLDLPRPGRATGSSRGAASGRSGRSARPQSTHGVDTTDTFDAGRRLARGAPRLHRRPRVGALRRPRVPRGPLARRRASGWAWPSRRRSRSSRWAGATRPDRAR